MQQLSVFRNINDAVVLFMMFALLFCVNVAFETLLIVSSGDRSGVNAR